MSMSHEKTTEEREVLLLHQMVTQQLSVACLPTAAM